MDGGAGGAGGTGAVGSTLTKTEVTITKASFFFLASFQLLTAEAPHRPRFEPAVLSFPKLSRSHAVGLQDGLSL